MQLSFQEQVLGQAEKEHANAVRSSPAHVVMDGTLSDRVFAFYLLNPLSIALFLARTSAPLAMVPVLAAVTAALRGTYFRTAFLAACAAYQSHYYILLVVSEWV